MKCKYCGGVLTPKGEYYLCHTCRKRLRRSMKAADGGGSGSGGPKRKRRAYLPIAGLAAAAVLLAVLLTVCLLPRRDAATAAATAAPLLTEAPTENVPVATTAAPTEAPTVRPIETPEPVEPARVHFRAVGDLMVHNLQLTHAKQSDGSYSFDPQYELVRSSLRSADYTIGNLECTISVNRKYSSYPKFRSPEALLDTLEDCGFDMLTLANNHILDGDARGFFHTVQTVKEHGFDFIGVGETKAESREPRVIEIEGIRFGFLAYTLGTNTNEKHSYNKAARVCIRYLDKADLKSDVQALRDAGAEVVICLPHWGIEEHTKPDSATKKYANRMIEAGVDIILGSHPHVVQPIELREVQRSRGAVDEVLIAWSMGNFISYMANEDVDCGIIMDFTVTREADGTIRIEDVGYVPVYVWGSKRDFHVLCSGEYLQEAPEGMPEKTYKRMKQSYADIVERCGTEFRVLSH